MINIERKERSQTAVDYGKLPLRKNMKNCSTYIAGRTRANSLSLSSSPVPQLLLCASKEVGVRLIVCEVLSNMLRRVRCS